MGTPGPQPDRRGKPDLLTVADAHSLDESSLADLYRRHINPGQLTPLAMLGFDRVRIDHADGMRYFDQYDRAILDFFGGFGALALGHNHPRVIHVRQEFQRQQRHEIAMAFPSQYAAALSRNLATITGGRLPRVMLGCTGSEAVETAVKLAERAQGPRRAGVAYASRAFHGKTTGALSVTDSSFYRANFTLPPGRYRVPFGDSATLERTLCQHRDIGALVLETVQGGAGVIVGDDDYFRTVRELCDRYGVLWIADEVQCGIGRTGRFFAFEHAGVWPDIVTLAKALGGGKTAISAVLARREVHDRAYGSAKTALIHGPATFSGMGEACCTAIETLHVLYDEGFLDNAACQGDYLMTRLEQLRQRHPRMIRQVRGRGLMVGLEFADVSDCVPGLAGRMATVLDKPLHGGLAALVGSLLLAEFDILVAFTEYNRNVIRLEPPLLLQRHHVDALVTALDDLLARGLRGLVTSYLRSVRRRRVPSAA